MFTVGVFAIILDEENNVLICHRRDHDLWNLPGGGLEKGETVENAIIREVAEETGLEVVIDRITGVYSKKDKNEVVFSFLCKIISGNIKLNDEADQIEYYSLDNIPHNFSPKQAERLKDYFNKPNKIHYKLQTGKPSIQLLKEGKL